MTTQITIDETELKQIITKHVQELFQKKVPSITVPPLNITIVATEDGFPPFVTVEFDVFAFKDATSEKL